MNNREIISDASHVNKEICIGGEIRNFGRSTTYPERPEYASYQFNNKVEFITDMVFWIFVVRKRSNQHQY